MAVDRRDIASLLLLNGTHLHVWRGHVNVDVFHSSADFDRLVYPPPVRRVACRYPFAPVEALASSTVRTIVLQVVRVVLRRLVCSGVRAVLILASLLKLCNDLHRVRMLRLRHLDLSLSLTRLRREEIPLRWTHLRMVPLHLNLMVSLVEGRGHIASIGWRVRVLSRPDIGNIGLIHRRPVMRRGRLRKEVVLVGWRLQVVLAVIGCVLLARNLNLNIRMGSRVRRNLATAVPDCLLFSIHRVFGWTVEVLSCLVHDRLAIWLGRLTH
jgi:hypothetical protein